MRDNGAKHTGDITGRKGYNELFAFCTFVSRLRNYVSATYTRTHKLYNVFIMFRDEARAKIRPVKNESQFFFYPTSGKTNRFFMRALSRKVRPDTRIRLGGRPRIGAYVNFKAEFKDRLAYTLGYTTFFI